MFEDTNISLRIAGESAKLLKHRQTGMYLWRRLTDTKTSRMFGSVHEAMKAVSDKKAMHWSINIRRKGK